MKRSVWLSAAAVIVMIGLPRPAAAQEHAHGQPPEGAACPTGQTCPAPEDHAAMQARHEAMMAEHAATAARLQELQDAMHAATGDAKVDAMAALLDELLAQHRAMHERMMEGHQAGMPGMEHGAMRHDDHAADRDDEDDKNDDS